MKPVKSDVGERNQERERNERFARCRAEAGTEVSYCLLAAYWVLAHAPIATAALNAGQAGFFSPAAAATIIFALIGYAGSRIIFVL